MSVIWLSSLNHNNLHGKEKHNYYCISILTHIEQFHLITVIINYMVYFF